MASCAPADWNPAARVAVLGAGLEGLSVLRALVRWGHRGAVTLVDDKPIALDASLAHVAVCVGPPSDGLLRATDVLVRSPGVPPSHEVLQRAQAQGVPRTSATVLAMGALRGAGVRVLAVTGSKGKSTTASLLEAALREAGKPVILAGNIGRPALDALDNACAQGATVVLELSSYQCHDLVLGPDLAVMLNLFPEHLDWHGGREAYYGSKQRLARTQREGDLTVYDGANATLCERLPLGPARHLAFGTRAGFHHREGAFWRGEARLFGDGAVPLRGLHNRHNACAMLAVGDALGVPLEASKRALEGFVPLPHRLELVGSFAGRSWVNDAISTAPEAASAALEAFGSEVSVLIAGGHDRGYDFAPLVRSIGASALRAVVTLGPSGARLAEALREAKSSQLVLSANSLDEAVALALKHSAPESVCLLSPASPSYGMFRNFEERGERFRALVRALGA